jgi:hypothetical protein
MGFEAPLALLALVAAGLPIAAHLLRRQDLPRRKLPTVVLLMRAEAASRKRVRIVDLLLLIVRVLLIAAAAIAVAGPFLRVTLAYGDGSVASVAIIVDDSMSMAGRGELLARAKERAAEVVGSLPAGSEIALIAAGSPARVLVPRTDRLSRAEGGLESLSDVSARGTDLAGAIALAERELSGALHERRQIVVLSDFPANAPIVAGDVETIFERIGSDDAVPNAAIVDARATPDPTVAGSASVAVEIRAQGMNGRELAVVLSRHGEELARERVEIDHGGARATLHVRVDDEDPAVVVSIDADDALALDDERGVLVRPPAGGRVLIVTGERSRNDEARFLAAAIDLAPADGGALTRQRADEETFAAMDLAGHDVVVLANVAAPSEATAERLEQFVAAGGGLLIAPGDRFDARAYTGRLGALLPARPGAAMDAPIEGPSPIDGSDLLPPGATGLDAATTTRRIAIEGDASVVLGFSDGTPALVMGEHGDGRTALLATTIDDDWTDFPYRPGFLPAMVSLLRRLLPRGSTGPGMPLPGEPVVLSAPAGAIRMRVLTPDGQAIEHTDLDEPVSIRETHAPGPYRVEIASRDRPLRGEPRLAFVIAAPPEESDLTPGEVPTSAGGGRAHERRTTVERPLAPWLFLLVGLFALTEAALRLRAAHLSRARVPAPSA